MPALSRMLDWLETVQPEKKIGPKKRTGCNMSKVLIIAGEGGRCLDIGPFVILV